MFVRPSSFILFSGSLETKDKPLNFEKSAIVLIPFLTSNIIGATKLDQLKENIESIHVELTDEILEDINAVHSLIPNPAP